MSDSLITKGTTNTSSAASTRNDEKPEKNSTKPPAIPLDWTKLNNEAAAHHPIRYPTDVMEISSDPEENYLEIIGTAGQKITNMGKDLHRLCSPNLTHLIFRSHLITKMEGFSTFKKLELLELYDNSIEKLEGLQNCSDEVTGIGNEGNGRGCVGDTLKILDMSYNVIREMDPVRFCPNLVELYLANNKIKTLSGLKNLSCLKKIDLGANRLRKMDELSGLTNLEELWLGKNKIEKIEGISSLTKLRRLDVQSNRLTSVENLLAQTETLEELYLAHNGINDEGAMNESGLALNFTELTILDLSKNQLTSCRPFEHMTTLDTLWISNNEILTFQDVEPLSGLSRLDEVYLEHNPIYKDADYRTKLKKIIPSLNQIDAIQIGMETHSDGTTQGLKSGQTMSIEKLRKWQDEAIARAKLESSQKR